MSGVLPSSSGTPGLYIYRLPTHLPSVSGAGRPAVSLPRATAGPRAGFLWVLTACAAWHWLLTQLPSRLLPSSGNQTGSVAGSRSCCHVSCSSGLKPVLSAGWAFPSPGLVSQVPPGPFAARAWGWGSCLQSGNGEGVCVLASGPASHLKTRQKRVGYSATVPLINCLSLLESLDFSMFQLPQLTTWVYKYPTPLVYGIN